MADDRCELLCLDLSHAEALRATRLSEVEAELLSRRGQALSDPTRVAIAVALLHGEELCVCDLAWIVERAQGLVSHHLKVLRTAGMVVARRDGRTVMYSLTDGARRLLSVTFEVAEVAG